MGKHNKLTDEQVAQMRHKECMGVSRAQIARDLGVSGACVTRNLGASRAYKSARVSRETITETADVAGN